jgi:hypothetical protein
VRRAGPAGCYVDGTRVIVDNSQGADARFVGDLCAALRSAGFEVELRDPSPLALYDTMVHFVVEGVSVRVPEELGAGELATIKGLVHDVVARRPNERQRSRAVPIYAGESRTVRAWVDGYDPGAAPQ